MAHAQQTRKSRLPAILITLLIVAGVVWAAARFLLGPTNILLMGLDEGKTRTDVVVLAHLDPQKRLVNLISIPRDTLVEINCSGLMEACQSPDKLAHAHVYGEKKGPEVTVKSVERLLGINIDHYVRVDFEGFQRVVDQLGGVDLVIDKNMYYYDPYATPPLEINLKAAKAPQHLNGEQALHYVRYRADGLGDIGRTERTKKFLVALARKAKEGQSLTKLPTVVSTAMKYVTTDIDFASAVTLAGSAMLVDLDQVHMATLPGQDDPNNPHGWVWVADRQKTAEMVDQLVVNPKAGQLQTETTTK